MSHKFGKEWEKEGSVLGAIRGTVFHRNKPLKEKISLTLHRLKIQHSRLEGASMRMLQHSKELFEKCVLAQGAKDSARAVMYAHECAEIRKIANVTIRCELALEKATLRLETIEEFGDFAFQMSPVANVINAVKSQITGIMPEVSLELGQIGENLNELVFEIGESTEHSWSMETLDSEAQKILSEANVLAEQRIKDRFPELPTQTPTVSMTERTQEHGLVK